MELDFSKPENLQTRDGRPVRIYATDGGGRFPIHGGVLTDNGWSIDTWLRDGSQCRSGKESNGDLVPKPIRVTGWLNVYMGTDNKTGYRTAWMVYATKEDAMAAQNGSLGQIYIDAEIQS